MNRRQMWIKKGVFWVALIISLISFSTGWLNLGNAYYRRKISQGIEESLEGSDSITEEEIDSLADQMHAYGIDVKPRKLIRYTITMLRVFEDAAISPHEMDKLLRSIAGIRRMLPEEAIRAFGLTEYGGTSLWKSKSTLTIFALILTILFIAYVISAILAIADGVLGRRIGALPLAIVTGIYFVIFIVVRLRMQKLLKESLRSLYIVSQTSDFKVHLSFTAYLAMAAALFAAIWWYRLQRECRQNGQKIVRLIDEIGTGNKQEGNGAPNTAYGENWQKMFGRGASRRRCPACGAMLDPGAQFCTRCGTKAEPELSSCPVCHAPVAPGARFCTKCGAELNMSGSAGNPSWNPGVKICPNCHRELDPDAKFCVYCGKKV